MSIVSIHRNPIDNSWAYDGTAGSSSRDPIHGFRTLRELYERASPGYAGRCSVPVLWDRRSESIVSNDSSAILRMLSTCFDELLPAERRESCKPHGALLPKELRGEIEELNERIAGDVSWGVYRAGMALDQEGYDEAMRKLFERLDGLEARLSDGRRFLFGEQLTETDIL